MRREINSTNLFIVALALSVGPSVLTGPALAETPETYLTEDYPSKEPSPWTSADRRVDRTEEYSGTMWISPDVLTPVDPTDLQSMEYVGVQLRRTFDRRFNEWVVQDAHVIKARYECGLTSVEVVVNTEFTQDQAQREAQRFAEVLGRIPPGLRYAVHELWIHGGDELAGGGNGSVLIHLDWALENWPFVEELFLHEAAHTTLDYLGHGAGAVDQASWELAMAKDGRAISTYARDFPAREDIAESYVAYALWKAEQADSTGDADAQKIEKSIPNRLAYLETLGAEFEPGTEACPVIVPRTVTNLQAFTRGKYTTVSWTRPAPASSVSRYEWRVAARPGNLGGWQAFGSAKTSSIVLENRVRGINWIIEVRAVWGSDPGPAARIRYRS